MAAGGKRKWKKGAGTEKQPWEPVDKTPIENYNYGMVEEQKFDNEPGKSSAGSGTPGKTKTRIHLSHDGLFKEKVLEEGGVVMNTVFQQLREEGKQIGVKEGKEIGVKEGEEKNKIRVALNCLMKGMDIKTISEITDLPVERIELLKTALQEKNG